MSTSFSIAGASTLVLDTHVVYDWLLFRDPGSATLAAAIEGRAVHWLATPAMRAEHFHVIARGRLAAWRPDLAALHAAWEAHCTLVAAPPPDAGRLFPRCSDPDDQMFIDLALTRRTRWLLSRDRAVLALARRLRPLGVEVLTPAAWTRAFAG